MSTNYYLVEPGTVYSPDESIHIGKTAGDMVMLQSCEDRMDSRVTSWAQWKAAIRAIGEVWNEYGVPMDAETFIGWIEDASEAGRRRQYDWVQEHAETDPYTASIRDTYWLDEDGFTFTSGEFF